MQGMNVQGEHAYRLVTVAGHVPYTKAKLSFYVGKVAPLTL